MYYCEECDIITEGVDDRSSEVDIVHGSSVEYTVGDILCEKCSGVLEEASKCELCENYCSYKICDECINENLNLNTALKVGGLNTETIEINGFTKYIIDDEELDKLISSYLVWKTDGNPDVANEIIKEYLLEDKYYFEDLLETLNKGRKENAEQRD